MELTTQRLLLRELVSGDLDAIHALHLLPEVDRYNTLGIPEHINVTAGYLQQWLMQQADAPRQVYTFAIVEAETHNLIGLMGLKMGKANYRNAEVWYKLHPASWGKGIATEALEKLLQFGFTSLGLHRIEAGCAVENTASVTVLEKAGMTREGRTRKLLPIGGEWMDNFFYAILDTDIQEAGEMH